MSGIAGQIIGASSGDQAPIGAYVQDATAPCANTNFIGVNTLTSYDRDVIGIGEAAELTCAVSNDTTEGTAQWVKAGEEISANDLLVLTSGVASVVDDDSETHTCLVDVADDGYFWAILIPGD